MRVLLSSFLLAWAAACSGAPDPAAQSPPAARVHAPNAASALHPPPLARAATATASTADRQAWLRDYSSTAPWAAAAAPAQSVSIVLMTSHFFGAYAATVPCKPVRGATPGTPGAWNLTCVYSEDRGAAEAADALW